MLGGVDIAGPHLHTIYPHGSTDELPYVTMGSGSLAAMAVFEAKYKKDLTVCFFLSLFFLLSTLFLFLFLSLMCCVVGC